MTLQECYAALGGNYNDAATRLRSDRMIQKFILRFLDDNSYTFFCDSMKAHNYEDAFLAAHTMKGICQNLSLTRLQQSSSSMADALRGGYTPQADELFDQLTEDYLLTVNAIKKFQEECGRE